MPGALKPLKRIKPQGFDGYLRIYRPADVVDFFGVYYALEESGNLDMLPVVDAYELSDETIPTLIRMGIVKETVPEAQFPGMPPSTVSLEAAPNVAFAYLQGRHVVVDYRVREILRNMEQVYRSTKGLAFRETRNRDATDVFAKAVDSVSRPKRREILEELERKYGERDRRRLNSLAAPHIYMDVFNTLPWLGRMDDKTRSAALKYLADLYANKETRPANKDGKHLVLTRDNWKKIRAGNALRGIDNSDPAPEILITITEMLSYNPRAFDYLHSPDALDLYFITCASPEKARGFVERLSKMRKEEEDYHMTLEVEKPDEEHVADTWKDFHESDWSAGGVMRLKDEIREATRMVEKFAKYTEKAGIPLTKEIVERVMELELSNAEMVELEMRYRRLSDAQSRRIPEPDYKTVTVSTGLVGFFSPLSQFFDEEPYDDKIKISLDGSEDPEILEFFGDEIRETIEGRKAGYERLKRYCERMVRKAKEDFRASLTYVLEGEQPEPAPIPKKDNVPFYRKFAPLDFDGAGRRHKVKTYARNMARKTRGRKAFHRSC